MKIKLGFLGKAISDVLDVPEETGNEFKLALSQPQQLGKINENIPHLPGLNTICVFRWNGYYEGGSDRGIRLYVLVDIKKE